MSGCDEQRDPLELLAADYLERIRQGESPSITEYQAAHPQLAHEIEELFPTIAVMERLKVCRQEDSGGGVSLGAMRPERVGDFRILREIGRGGMGIVYEAFQESLDRHVAVKILPRQALLEPRQLQRFQREAQTAARLHHTNIVPVFGVGQQDGFHYIVMQLIRGAGLDTILPGLRQRRGQIADAGTTADSEDGATEEDVAGWLAEALLSGEFGPIEPPAAWSGAAGSGPAGAVPSDTAEWASSPSDPVSKDAGVHRESASGEAMPGLSPSRPGAVPPRSVPELGPAYWRSVAQIGKQVAEAVHYAHVQGTFHRDIKPANLILDCQGIAWVADFGLAKAMEQDHFTQTGMLVGTLRYMAPEQMAGKFDARSDLYSLGLTLYEMLVLQPAFDHASRAGLIHQISEGQLVRPRKLDPSIPRDLETIVLKACAREPGDRYASAAELARDLARFLEDRPIHARRTSSLERLWRWARRNRIMAGLAASVLVLLVALATVASVAYVRTRRANIEEARQRQKAEATSALALAALDKIFQEFAPDRSMPASPLLLLGATGEEITVPVQPVLSKEAAALLEHLLVFYDRLAAEGGDDARLRRKVAEANRRIGDIRQRLGQAEQAKIAYRRAIELYGQLPDAGSAEIRMEMARAWNELGNVSSISGGPEAGRASHEQALALLSGTPDGSAVLQHDYELARTHYFLGKRPGGPAGPPYLTTRGARGRDPERPGGHQHREGPPEFRWAGPRPGILTPPGGWHEEEDDRATSLALAMARHIAAEGDFGPPGDASHDMGEGRFRPPPGPFPFPIAGPHGDDAQLRKAIELLEALVAQTEALDYRHLLARCYREVGPQGIRGRAAEKGGAARAAEILEKLVEGHPDVADYRYDLSETYAALAAEVGAFGPHAMAADRRQAQAMLEKGLVLAEALAAEHPNIPDYTFGLVQQRTRLAGVLMESAPAQAEPHLRKAMEQQTLLVERFPENLAYRFGAVLVRETLAALLEERGQLDEAGKLLAQSIDVLERDLGSSTETRPVRGALAHHYFSLASILRRMGDTTGAADVERKAEQLR